MTANPTGLLMIQRLNDVRIIEFMETSVLDGANIERIREEITQVVEEAGVPKLVISFAGVKHISSAVLGMLMAVHKKVQAEKGELRLAAVSPRIIEVFQITRLDKMLKMYPSVDDAMIKF